MIGVDDGIIAPDGGLMVSGEKGTYKLNENDSIVAGTNLNKPGRSSSTSSAPQIDLSPLMERINVLITIYISIINTNQRGVFLFNSSIKTLLIILKTV